MRIATIRQRFKDVPAVTERGLAATSPIWAAE